MQMLDLNSSIFWRNTVTNLHFVWILPERTTRISFKSVHEKNVPKWNSVQQNTFGLGHWYIILKSCSRGRTMKTSLLWKKAIRALIRRTAQTLTNLRLFLTNKVLRWRKDRWKQFRSKLVHVLKWQSQSSDVRVNENLGKNRKLMFRNVLYAILLSFAEKHAWKGL